MASGPETILVGPLNEPNGNILRRSLTLEGQRELSVTKRGFNSRIRAILHIKDSSDITKQAFKDAIAKSKGDVQKRLNLKDLAYKYDCLKHRKFTKGSHQLFQCFKITDGSQNGVVKSNIDTLRVDKPTTFSKLSAAISVDLGLNCQGGLRMAALCLEPMTKDLEAFLTRDDDTTSVFSRHRILRSCSPGHCLAMGKIIAFLLEQYLEEKVPNFVDFANPHIHDDRRRLLNPPSRSVARGSLDPRNFADNCIELAWQAKAPIYTSNFDIYIRERHKSFPKNRRVVLKLYPKTITRETALIIFFQNRVSLTHFSKNWSHARLQGSTSNTTSTWSTNSEVLLSICALYSVIIIESTTFLQGCSVELEKLHLIGRQNPTATKVRYLVHLEDCRSSAYEGMIHCLEVLDSVAKWTDTLNTTQPLWDAGEPFAHRFAVLRKDLEFICDNLSDIERQGKELQQTLRDHLELTRNDRSFMLSIVAAIYLPLSFAANLFGMNMNPTTFAGPRGFSDWITSWIMNSPIGVQNSTKAIISSIDSSGTRTYTWTTFGITTGCLFVTIPLSLGIGRILRSVYRNYINHTTHWLWTAVLACVVFGGLFVGCVLISTNFASR